MKGARIECIFKVRTRREISSKRVEKLVKELIKYFSKQAKVRKSLPSDKNHPFLTFVFISSTQSKTLNFRYRKKNYATDVLSFAESHAHLGLGELVLCPQVLKRQAKAAKHSFKIELDLMVIHGFLHLLGYDHEKSRREELKMMALQDKLFIEFSGINKKRKKLCL